MRNSKNHSNASARRIRSGFAAAACALAACVLPASALGANDTTQFSVTAGSLSLSAAPNYPDLPSLTLNGQAQTLNAQMGSFTVVDATGSGSGWNVTVVGDSTAGKSAVFKAVQHLRRRLRRRWGDPGPELADAFKHRRRLYGP